MGVECAAAGQGVLIEQGEDCPGGPPRIGRGARPFHRAKWHAQDAVFAGVIHAAAGKGIAPEHAAFGFSSDIEKLCNLGHGILQHDWPATRLSHAIWACCAQRICMLGASSYDPSETLDQPKLAGRGAID